MYPPCQAALVWVDGGRRFNLFSEVDLARLRTDSFEEKGAAEGL